MLCKKKQNRFCQILSNYVIWINGKVTRVNEVALPADCIAVKYGASAFITLKYYAGRYLHFDLHHKRLCNGLEYLGVPAELFPSKDDIKTAFMELADAKGLGKAVCRARFQVSVADKGGYQKKENPTLFLSAELHKYDPAGRDISLASVSTRVCPASVRPSHLKLGNNLHYMMAWREADKKGADNALMLTHDGVVSETATGNLFWSKGDTVFTPDETCDILPGIMRKVCFELAGEIPGLKIESGRYQPGELYEADHLWMTNSVSGILPVKKLDNRIYNTQAPIYSSFYERFEKYKTRYLKE